MTAAAWPPGALQRMCPWCCMQSGLGAGGIAFRVRPVLSPALHFMEPAFQRDDTR